jgi:hypothetical protein
LSLTCLRTCLEAFQVAPECVALSSHQDCDSEECKVESINKIEICLEKFLHELSRVMFKKSNLKSRTWWLSGFYSFCIHSIVRRGLLILIQTRQERKFRDMASCSQYSAAEKYLVVALQFFVATSGTYDPLTKSKNSPESITSETKLSLATESDKHFKAAREAVKQEFWTATGISGSMQYLQNLFQDKKEALPSNGYSPYPPHSGTEAPYNYAASAQQQVQQRQHQIPKPTDSNMLRLEALIAVATSQDN